MRKEPLWMPQGSVRAVLAIALIGGTLTMILSGIEVPAELWTLDGVVGTLYFERRRTPEA